jgi:hypothetical protein
MITNGEQKKTMTYDAPYVYLSHLLQTHILQGKVKSFRRDDLDES